MNIVIEYLVPSLGKLFHHKIVLRDQWQTIGSDKVLENVK